LRGSCCGAASRCILASSHKETTMSIPAIAVTLALIGLGIYLFDRIRG
jgi:hypothetical protein